MTFPQVTDLQPEMIDGPRSGKTSPLIVKLVSDARH